MALFEQRMKVQFATRRRDSQRKRPLTTWMLIAIVTAGFIVWLFVRQLIIPGLSLVLPQFSQEFIPILEMAGGLTVAFLWAVMLWDHLPFEIFISPQSSDSPKQTLYDLTPAEFEAYVAKIFAKRGYKIEIRGRSGDLGVDIEVRQPNGKKAVVQCKRYKSTVGPEIVRELYGTLIHERAAHAFLVTTAEISDAAHEWANGKPMTLIDGPTLVKLADSLEIQNPLSL